MIASIPFGSISCARSATIVEAPQSIRTVRSGVAT